MNRKQESEGKQAKQGTEQAKQQQQQPQQQQQSKKTYYTTIAGLIRSKEQKATMKKRLAYKQWILYIFRNQDRFWIKIIAFKKGKMVTILNIYPNDIKYLNDLLQEIEAAFKQNGIRFTEF